MQLLLGLSTEKRGAISSSTHELTSITLDRINLRYPSPARSLKATILRTSDSRIHYPPSLVDITLEIERGDRVALIGLNGAGKTTLLRVMAGILPATSGLRRVHGSIATLLGEGVGFEMEMSGWDNIYSRLIVAGLRLDDVRSAQKQVAEFADIGDAIYRPMKTYSAGMVVRVGFSVATQMNPDILLIDEVIGAGDIEFADKATARMENLLTSANILVLASHNLALLETLCNRAVWLEDGRVIAQGAASKVIDTYREKYS